MMTVGFELPLHRLTTIPSNLDCFHLMVMKVKDFFAIIDCHQHIMTAGFELSLHRLTTIQSNCDLFHLVACS